MSTANNDTIEPEWESPNEAAQRSGVCRATIYHLIGEGHIEARKLGSRTLVRVASRRTYFNALPKAQIAPPRKMVRP
jgi:excisionase family DNA binding protein